MPFPSAETTPPVMKMKRVSGRLWGIQALGIECTDGPDGRQRSRRGQQLFGVLARRAVRGLRAEHPHQLLDHAVAVELPRRW